MAYVDSRTDSHRAAKIIAVSAFHAAAIYGLVIGLGAQGIREIVANLPTTNYPADPPPTPEADPPKLPETNRVFVPPSRPDFDLPDLGSRDVMIALPPIPDGGHIVLGPPRPPVAPSFTPSQPRPRNDPGGWVLTSDYPPRDIREGNEGTTRVLLSIDAGGDVRDCRIAGSSGHPSLDEAACRNVSRRARFEPARNGADEKVAGSYASSVRWVIPKD